MDSRGAVLITLTTDFGLADGTVGAMIGVIKSICPQVEVLTLAADVPVHDIPRGAWALFQAAPFFPPQSIHLAVVDPGVGSDRRGILVETDRGIFIGPDNGVLSWAMRGREILGIYSLENPGYRIASVGVTFDGRDLFAPAAAHVAAGADPATVGPRIDDPVILSWPEPRIEGETIEGEILVTDHFGNLITNVPLAQITDVFGDRPFRVVLPGMAEPDHHARLARSYEDITTRLGAVINGTGLVEIAAPKGSAADLTGGTRGDRVRIEKGE